MTSDNDWSLVCYSGDTKEGAVSRIVSQGEGLVVQNLPVAAAVEGHVPVLLKAVSPRSTVIMAAADKSVSTVEGFPVNGHPTYAYRDKASGRMWYTNDGDKETGCDTLNCPDGGASVVVVAEIDGQIKHLKTFQLGRGHHVVEFTYPTEAYPSTPKRVFVTSLLDGIMDIIGNDESDANSYLQVMQQINLLEADKEDAGTDVPNNAFPHGMVFSPATGKLYSLNNGYKSVVVIDPVSMQIENSFSMKGSSNLLLSPCGHFVVGKGADRKSDAEHVIGTLPVMDLRTGETVHTVELKDVYPSTYRFAPDGKTLHVTTATTGKGAQKDNLKNNVHLVFDATQLPSLPLLHEIPVGTAENGRRPHAFLRDGDGFKFAFIPNPTDGTVTVLDNKHQVIDTIKIADKPAKELSIELWDAAIYGC